jgi:hypothetical protein
MITLLHKANNLKIVECQYKSTKALRTPSRSYAQGHQHSFNKRNKANNDVPVEKLYSSFMQEPIEEEEVWEEEPWHEISYESSKTRENPDLLDQLEIEKAYKVILENLNTIKGQTGKFQLFISNIPKDLFRFPTFSI